MEINKIKNPKFLKEMNIKDLNILCEDIRKCIISTVSHKGGHLSSNLGVVELTVAVHTVFNAPSDKIIFDVGHQCYTHKILTGRYQEFVDSLRDYNGLSGYQKMDESIYDSYEAGHSSTSISAVCGFLKSQEITGENYDVIDIIGDSSIASGLAFEGLNNLSSLKKRAIIILNDNDMAISKPVGGLDRTFSKIRTLTSYTSTKKGLKSILKKNQIGGFFFVIFKNIKDTIRRMLIDTTIFENLGLEYLGPIDGHNLKKLIKVLKIAKDSDRSVVVHVITQKGKGYEPAEKDLVGKWHGVGEFDVITGSFKSSHDRSNVSWSQAISAIVQQKMSKDKQIVAITPAMIEGSKMQQIFKDYPDRAIDVGIAEEHAFTMAGSLYLGGAKPYICVYSTFLQRAYDEIIHDVARMNIPLVVGVDRAGIVGKDGSTHQGIYDVGMLRSIPHTVIAMPKDLNDARAIMQKAFEYQHLFFIRYPRESTPLLENQKKLEAIKIGQWDFVANPDAVYNVIVTGPNYDKVTLFVAQKKLVVNVIFARFYQPIDEGVLLQVAQNGKPIAIYDLYSAKTGLFDAISAFYAEKEIKVHLMDFSIPLKFIKNGDIPSIIKHLGLDIETVFERIEKECEGHGN